MKIRLLLFALLLSGFALHAQDAYHNSVVTLLETQYDLPQGEWIFTNTESGNLAVDISYGGNFSNQSVDDQVFSQVVRASVSSGNNPWDAGWKLLNQPALQSGDKVLVVFYLRSVNGPGKVNFFLENNSSFTKEIYLSLLPDTEWQRYLVPVELASNYSVGNLAFGFHLAEETQIVEIGGFTAVNYDNQVSFEELPNETNAELYGGYQDDAPWRAEAATRIEQLRTAELTISVVDTDGNAVENAAVSVEQVRHRFDWGTAVVANRFAGNNQYNPIYENKVVNLDGNGHGFNTVVFENDLKWDAWEEEWLVNKEELEDAVQWLRNQGLKIRGHNLVWPGTEYLPEDIPQNYNNPTYVKNRIFEHIEEIMTYPGIGDEIHDWDVLNEVATNQDVANAFAGTPGYTTGRELYEEIFEKAHEVDPDAGLWLNDFVTMTLGNTAGDLLYDRFKQYAGELVDSGAPIDGLGFQGHIGGNLYSIYDVLGTLDDFYDSYNLPAKITEFDLPPFVEEELAATYLRDFMTAVYSHESVDGFLFWNFWDGQTWMNSGANLYRQDWSETPAHAAFVDLLFNEWWTSASLTSSADGSATVRAYKGTIEISYVCNGETIRDTVNVEQAMSYEIVCDNIATGTGDALPHEELNISPNPSRGNLTIERNTNDRATVTVFDTTGRPVFRTETTDTQVQLRLDRPAGVYLVEFRTAAGVATQRVVLN